jgi:hypothetical protein
MDGQHIQKGTIARNKRRGQYFSYPCAAASRTDSKNIRKGARSHAAQLSSAHRLWCPIHGDIWTSINVSFNAALQDVIDTAATECRQPAAANSQSDPARGRVAVRERVDQRTAERVESSA